MSLLPLFLSPSSQLNPKCRQFSASQGLKLYAKPPVPPPPPARMRHCGSASFPAQDAARWQEGGGGKGRRGGVALCFPLLLVPSFVLNLLPWLFPHILL